jgi:hypothetical protein
MSTINAVRTATASLEETLMTIALNKQQTVQELEKMFEGQLRELEEHYLLSRQRMTSVHTHILSVLKEDLANVNFAMSGQQENQTNG